jgi:hypothetical protein
MNTSPWKSKSRYIFKLILFTRALRYGDDYDEYKPIKHDDYDEYKPVKK